MKILADATLPHLDLAFPAPFKITYYHSLGELFSLLPNQSILVCRSTLKVNNTLLAQATALEYIGTASSGSDHIDKKALLNKNIQLFDAQGSNALAVADYVIATLAFLEEHVGFNIKKAGIIGVGAVGTEISRRLNYLGYDLVHYDPLKQLKEPTFQSASLSELSDCPLICVHANLHKSPVYPSYHLINENFLSKLPHKSVIINAARGGIVDEAALLTNKNKIFYCTDVFSDEPAINPAIVQYATLCTPHIAGHSKEAKDNAIFLLSKKIHEALSLPLPNFQGASTRCPLALPAINTNWQDWISHLYSPYPETIALKTSVETLPDQDSNLREALSNTFLTLRAAHRNRHDFCRYAVEGHRFEHLVGKN
ncbi:MAG: 4-phosphoerythronate dehydrogenase [Legionella sp.]|nr:4-phosphoerythronate dehydrogenase [Legionella sp.]